MKTKLALACSAVLLLFANVSAAEETDANEVFKKTLAAYANLQTYRSQCTSVCTISGRGVTVTIRSAAVLKMKKPNQYLISWEQKVTAPKPQDLGAGVLWSGGKQPSIFDKGTTPTWSRLKDDKSAINYAMKMVSGVPDVATTLFLLQPTLEDSPFWSLVDPQLQKSEKIAGEECYVVGHKSKMFKKETYWISKATFLIRQCSHSTNAAEELLETNYGRDLDGTGQQMTAQERSAKIKAKIKEYRASDPSGTVTTAYSKIDAPEFTSADFEFKLPPGTQYQMVPAIVGGIPE